MARSLMRSLRAFPDVRAGSIALFALALGSGWSLSFASFALAQAEPVTVRLELDACAPSWFDGDALARALSVELVADGMRVGAAGTLPLSVSVPCGEDAPAIVTLALGSERESVSLVDLAASVRMRVLALASRDFVRSVLARPTSEAAGRQVQAVAAPELDDPPPQHEATRLASPRTTEVHDLPPTETPPLARWLSVGLSIRGLWLGLRVVAPSLSIDGEARLLGTPLVLWLAVDGAYAWGTDGLGEVRAFNVGGRVGARLVIDLAPFTLSASLGLLVAYARAEGASRLAGVRQGAVDGALVGLDGAIAASLAVSTDVRLILALGVLGYLVGFEARAEDRPVILFRDAAPWASFGVAIDLAP